LRGGKTTERQNRREKQTKDSHQDPDLFLSLNQEPREFLQSRRSGTKFV
jgi:hypothetical protein